MKRYRTEDDYTYSAEFIDGKWQFTITFTDSTQHIHHVTVSKDLFLAIQRLKREENRIVYSTERYISHYIESADDEEISSIAFYPLPTSEDEVIATEASHTIYSIIGSMTNVQRRRFVMRYFDGRTFEEIARREHCSKMSAKRSVDTATQLFEKKLKKFYPEGLQMP